MLGDRRERVSEDSLSAKVDGYFGESEFSTTNSEKLLLTIGKTLAEMEEGSINGRIVLDLR
jgi:hypothetical protein